ncbi:MAG: hypothetical protein LBK44_03930 [Spirochaetales bacterium]|jgi:hypothetical protein|nr:hypothetical protein [Spirochaetales bacterium]
MEQRKVAFISSAFRHNFTEADIRWALDNHLADGVIEEGDAAIRIAVGFDPSVNLLLEVMYHELEDGTALVFHAMKCRKKWRVELEIEE